MLRQVVVAGVRSGTGLPEEFSRVGVTLKPNFAHDLNL